METTSKKTILKKLEALAFQETTAFCYGCYKKAPTGQCETCGTDDLMRLMEGVGCEYGTEWVVLELLREHLNPVDVEDTFETMIEDCYSEQTTVGWLKLNTADIIKKLDPVSWDTAKDEYISSLEEDDQIISFDNGTRYYWLDDIEKLLADKLQEKAS